MRHIKLYIITFTTRYFSFGIAVALSAAISGAMAAVFSLYYADGTRIPIPESVFTAFLISNAMSWIIHALLFGIAHRAGFPGFPSAVALINRMIYAREGRLQIRENGTDENYRDLLKALTQIPWINAIVAMLTIVMVLSALLVTGLSTSAYTLREILLVLTAGFITLFVHGGFSLLLGEHFTGEMRSRCKQLLTEKGIPFTDKPVSSVRLKAAMFLILFMVALFISNSLMYYNSEKITSVIIFAVLATLFAVWMSYLIFALIYDSLKELQEAADDLRQGGAGLLYPKSIDSEFISLAAGFISASKTIRDYQKNLEYKVDMRTRELQSANEKLSEKDEILQKELDFAADIQTGMIPSGPVEWNGLRFSGFWQAMEKVSGDYYDLYPASGNRLGVLMADVSGHGVPAALITTMAKVAFGQAVTSTFHPSEIFARVNHDLTRMIHTQDYLTAFFLSFDETHHFYYANASHQLARLIRKETSDIERLDTHGIFIGALAEAGESYEEKENRLQPGDRIVLFTDGVVERRNSEKVEFGEDRFEKLLLELNHLPVDKMAEAILTQITDFSGDVPASDDTSLLIIEADADYGRFLRKLAYAFEVLEKNKKEKAAALFDEAIAIYSQNLNSLRAAGIVNYELANYDRAETLFDKYLRLSDNNAEIYYWLSIIKVKTEKYDRAEVFARQAVTMRPNYGEAWNTLGVALFNLKKYDEALSAFERAASILPEDSVIRASIEKTAEVLKNKENE